MYMCRPLFNTLCWRQVSGGSNIQLKNLELCTHFSIILNMQFSLRRSTDSNPCRENFPHEIWSLDEYLFLIKLKILILEQPCMHVSQLCWLLNLESSTNFQHTLQCPKPHVLKNQPKGRVNWGWGKVKTTIIIINPVNSIPNPITPPPPNQGWRQPNQSNKLQLEWINNRYI